LASDRQDSVPHAHRAGAGDGRPTAARGPAYGTGHAEGLTGSRGAGGAHGDGGEPRRLPPRSVGLPGVPRVGGLPRSTAVAVSTATILCRVCGVSRSVPARSRTCLTLGGPGCCPVPAGGASREVWAARHNLCAVDSRGGTTATGAGNMLPTQARPRWVVVLPMPVRGRHACRTNGMAWAQDAISARDRHKPMAVAMRWIVTCVCHRRASTVGGDARRCGCSSHGMRHGVPSDSPPLKALREPRHAVVDATIPRRMEVK
jgi:hypothetical protein